jgi:hypothetical protein
MSDHKLSQDATFQLFRIPREKEILDYVMQVLCENAGPERQEFIEGLFTMYRTSAGFDPIALSKGRVKRLKAADFRKMLQEVDAQIAVVLNSEGYKKILAQGVGYEAVFREFSQLSSDVTLHPALSLTSELEHLENSFRDQEVPELALLFYRNHPTFIEEVFQRDGYSAFLENFDRATDRAARLQRQFRLGFSLIQLEQQADRGLQDEKSALDILRESEQLLVQEQNAGNRCRLLLYITRASLLTVTPSRYLSPYISHLDENLPRFMVYHHEAGRLVLRLLAMYHIAAGRDKRLAWLEQAETEARKLELHDERPGFRFIRCMVEADTGNIDAALVALNDAEHLIYKATSRSLSARNNWVRLSEYRTLLFALKGMEGDTSVAAQMTLLQQLAEDMGRHRHEMAVMLLEWKALQLLLTGDVEDALINFDRAKNYRKASTTHPWYLLDKFFVTLLSKTKKKSAVGEIALELEQLNEPFYSAVMTAVMRKAVDFCQIKLEKQP